MRLLFVRVHLLPPGAGAVTVWPFCFVSRRTRITESVRRHEGTHGKQQLLAILIAVLACLLCSFEPALLLIHGGLYGLAARFVVTQIALGYVAGTGGYAMLYILVLPVGWNPFRAHWEREAYRAEGASDKQITEILKRPPYYLWWTR